jgi:hypothetical protein
MHSYLLSTVMCIYSEMKISGNYGQEILYDIEQSVSWNSLVRNSTFSEYVIIRDGLPSVVWRTIESRSNPYKHFKAYCLLYVPQDLATKHHIL